MKRQRQNYAGNLSCYERRSSLWLNNIAMSLVLDGDVVYCPSGKFIIGSLSTQAAVPLGWLSTEAGLAGLSAAVDQRRTLHKQQQIPTTVCQQQYRQRNEFPQRPRLAVLPAWLHEIFTGGALAREQ